jgi:hypothetical protein
MAGPVSRSVNTVEKEILKFPCGLDAIKSVVLRASGVDQLASAVTGLEGKIGLRAGTVLQKVSGDSQNRYEPWDGGAASAVEGILGDNIFFHANDTDNADKAADVLFHNCVFDVDKLTEFGSNYVGNETDVEDALYTCRFEGAD